MNDIQRRNLTRTLMLLLVVGANCRFEPHGQSPVDARSTSLSDGPARGSAYDAAMVEERRRVLTDQPRLRSAVSTCQADESDGVARWAARRRRTSTVKLNVETACWRRPSSATRPVPVRLLAEPWLPHISVSRAARRLASALCKESGLESACKRTTVAAPWAATQKMIATVLLFVATAPKRETKTCDPLSSCPTTCPAEGCQLRKLINAGTCNAECVNDRLQSVVRERGRMLSARMSLW
jgi:hypothetical protein